MELYLDGDELVWRRIYPGLPNQAGRARAFVAYLLAGLSNLDDAVLVTSEFVSNALRHTASAQPGGQFLVEVRRRHDGATVTLVDQGSAKEPAIPDLDDMSECGRGLYTAKVLASELTWSGDHTSRTVTAFFKVGR